jgi:hypothetical protein
LEGKLTGAWEVVIASISNLEVACCKICQSGSQDHALCT